MNAIRATTLKILLSGLIIGLFVSEYSHAQTVNETSIIHQIHSKLLDEDRMVSVFLPDSYKKSENPFPVLVVLDGEDFARPVAGMTSYYSKLGKCPELIVVGIESKDRWRDYTPTKASIPDGTPLTTSGGATLFMKFLENECMPYLESTYRISPFHVLYGHSIAGLFVVNSVLEKESNFAGFIATSPSLWWDSELMSSKSKTYSGPDVTHSRYLFLAIGDEGPTMLNPLLNFIHSLKENPKPNVYWTYRQFEDIDHQTMPIKTFIYGFEYIFSDWQMPQHLYEEGLSAIIHHYDNLSKKYRQKILPPEKTINRLGYMALNQGKLDEAIKIFQCNINLYPLSANVYDSMGEACLAAGDTTKALENYKKTLELNPDNSKARENIKKLQSEKQDGGLNNLAFVLLSEARLPGAEAITLAFSDFAAPGEELRAEAFDSEDSNGDKIISLTLSTGEKAFVALMPVPVPDGEADQFAQFSLSRFRNNWRLPPHNAHLLITFHVPADNPPIVELSRFTSLLAAVIKASSAVGVYWGDAGATHDSEFFTSVASDRSVASRMMLWSGVSIAHENDGRLSLLSLGMEQLRLPNLLLVAGKNSEDIAIETMYDLLVYIAKRGEPLTEGDTVGRTEDERLPVHYVNSPVDSKKKVWRVELP
ncbi:DUF4261 domain-containing protein [bacterium]|nr:DUF4261 domain-containing protein [candidate division CSSED10-310 bacterium]